MKRFSVFMLLLFSISLALAQCNLDASLINQNPYPAVPGEYVKLVFQISGVDNSDCQDITFDLLEDYPIRFDPDKSGVRTFRKVDYIRNYDSSILIPYDVRIDKDAIDGMSRIEATIQSGFGRGQSLRSFNLEIKNTIADFEVYITNYDYLSKELTIEILNIESSDVEALTLEIPRQEGVSIRGSNRIVVGDLDSNEYTSADFEAIIENDGEIKLNIIYSDAINVRRSIEKTVYFDSSYFINRASNSEDSKAIYYIIAAVALIVAWIIYKKVKKSKKKKIQ